MTLFDWLLVLVAVGLLLFGLRPTLQDSVRWRVVVTPLASIIGSGFLVVAPLLGVTVGYAAPLAMFVIVAFAYGIGVILRFNIRHAEPLLAEDTSPANLFLTERLSNLVLSFAYIVSVAFYLRLLSSFVLRGTSVDSEIAGNILTTAILVWIAFVGWGRGLFGLERLEKYSVTVKLCIIGALMIGLARHDLLHGFDSVVVQVREQSAWEIVRVLGGMLLVVQGFETARYMGEEYSAADRIRGMRVAQIFSGLIYVVFVLLVTPLLHLVDPTAIDETSIVDIARAASIVLPPMLIIAAVMSQFSAAIADTVGAGGLVAEETGRKVSSRAGYVAVCACGILLVWLSNIFEIISLASRAFAGYYFLQTVVALVTVRRVLSGPELWIARSALLAAAIGLILVVIFAKAVA